MKNLYKFFLHKFINFFLCLLTLLNIQFFNVNAKEMVNKTQRYIKNEFQKYGYEVKEQFFEEGNTKGKNIIAYKKGISNKEIILASKIEEVSSILEMAKDLNKTPSLLNIRFVVFDKDKSSPKHFVESITKEKEKILVCACKEEIKAFNVEGFYQLNIDDFSPLYKTFLGESTIISNIDERYLKDISYEIYQNNKLVKTLYHKELNKIISFPLSKGIYKVKLINKSPIKFKCTEKEEIEVKSGSIPLLYEECSKMHKEEEYAFEAVTAFSNINKDKKVNISKDILKIISCVLIGLIFRNIHIKKSKSY